MINGGEYRTRPTEQIMSSWHGIQHESGSWQEEEEASTFRGIVSGWPERKKEQTNHHASGLNECACEMVFGEPSNYHTYCANRNRQPEDAAVWDAAAVTGPERGAASACNICKSLIYSADDRPGLVHLFMFSQCPLFVPANVQSSSSPLPMRSHSTIGSPQINAGSVQFAVKLEYPGTATNCCGQFIIAAVITNWQE